MLVIYDLILEEATRFPAQVTIQIPVDAQSLSASNVDQDGVNIAIESVVHDIGLWKDVHLTATTPLVHIEYYDPNLVKQGDRRIF